MANASHGTTTTPITGFWKQFTWDDIVVAIVVHSIAEPINIAAGEAFVNLQNGREWVGWAYGIPLAVIGTTFHWWKRLLLPSVPAWIARNGGWLVFLTFLAVSGFIFMRMTTPINSSLPAVPSTPPALPRLPEQKHTAEAQLSVRVVPQAPSPLLGLTDATRWRFIKSFLDSIVGANGARAHCSAAVAVKMDQPGTEFAGRADRLWDELQPLLQYSNWEIIGGGLGGMSYQGGITILIGAGRGDPFICGTELAERLQSQTHIKVSVRKDQVTPKLDQCNFQCVELQIGDAVDR